MMKVLFISGSGNISSAVSRRAIEKGIELYHLNRGNNHMLGVTVYKWDSVGNNRLKSNLTII